MIRCEEQINALLLGNANQDLGDLALSSPPASPPAASP